MDHSYRPQRIHAHASRADGPSRSEQHSRTPLIASAKPYAQPSRTSSLQSYYTPLNGSSPPNASSPPIAPTPSSAPTPRHVWSSNTSPHSYWSSHTSPHSFWSSNTSPHSYYTANASPLSNLSTSSSYTQSSNMSFPYSVTSINSHNSRKNILYPRRAHPPPAPPLAVPVPAEFSHDARIWFLCTSLLPNTEIRLVPAGKVLLKSLGLLGKFSQLIPAQTDEATHYCSELFITLAHEVHLKCGVRAKELEVPCKLLHTTFKDILHKSGTFSASKTPKWPTDGALTLQRLSNVSIALFSVLGAFERALSTINPTMDGRRGEHYRMALLELSTPTGLTMKTYRTKLNQFLAQTHAQLNSLGQSEGLHPPSASLLSMIPQEISTIEGSEAEGEGSTANGHTLSSGDSGKNSLPRRILRRLIPSSAGRKDF